MSNPNRRLSDYDEFNPPEVNEFLTRNSVPSELDVIDAYVGPRSSLNSDILFF